MPFCDLLGLTLPLALLLNRIAAPNALSDSPSSNTDCSDPVEMCVIRSRGLFSKYALNATDDITWIKPPINTTRISIQKMHVVTRCADNFRPIDKNIWLNMFGYLLLMARNFHVFLMICFLFRSSALFPKEKKRTFVDVDVVNCLPMTRFNQSLSV